LHQFSRGMTKEQNEDAASKIKSGECVDMIDYAKKHESQTN